MTTVYIGIDPTAGRRLLDYAILDDDLAVVALAKGTLASVLDTVRSRPAAFVAVDAPQSPNAGLMASPARRRRLGLAKDDARWVNFKVGEYELRRRNIKLYNTPAAVSAAPAWMRLGFKLYAELKAGGFRAYRPGLKAPRQMLEVHPHACFTVLLGRVPLKKDSLEGRLQRQLQLYEEGLRIADPMQAFEEVTRHSVLAGLTHLPAVYEHDALDALAAAYTAFIAARLPERLTLVGDPGEGQIALPVAPAEFKDLYR